MWEPALTADDIESLVDGPPRVFQVDGRRPGVQRAAACPALGIFVECVCRTNDLGPCIYRLPTLTEVILGQPPQCVGYLQVSDTIAVCVSGTFALVSKSKGPRVVVFDLETRTEVSRFGDFVATSALEAVGSTAIVVGCTLSDVERYPGAGTAHSCRVWIYRGEANFTSWSCVRVLEFPLGRKHISICDQGTLLGIVHEGCVKIRSTDGVQCQQMEFVSLCDDMYPDVDRKEGPVVVPTTWNLSRSVQHGHGWIGASALFRDSGTYCDTLCFWDGNGPRKDLTPFTNFDLVNYIMPIPNLGYFIRDRGNLFVVVPDALYRIHTMSPIRVAWMVAVARQSFSWVK